MRMLTRRLQVTEAEVAESQIDLTAPDADLNALMQQARAASELLKALSHETRLLILCLLTQGERTVSDLEQVLGLPQAAVSQHLARLRSDELVRARRDGRMIHYSIARPEVTAVVGALHEAFCGKLAPR
jgi:DNA-binding transcriptional ArsR family regulator